jgi:hypothetical protein
MAVINSHNSQIQKGKDDPLSAMKAFGEEEVWLHAVLT